MISNKLPRNSFFAAAIGTMIEYYDCALFTILLPILSPLFFPAHSAYESLVKSFYLLFLVMLARPLGGILFGNIGDFLGRRKALSLSMYGIALATIAIGLTPTYATIGIAAPILLTIAKIIQIFCFGGEYNGAGIYVTEHAKPTTEGFVGSMLTATMLAGALFAAIIGIIITLPNSPSYSWRLAYIFGGIVGIIGIFARKNLMESPSFQKATTKQTYMRLIKNYPLEILAGIFVGGFATIPFTTVLSFMMPVLMTKGMISSLQFMIFQSCLIFIAIISLIAAGYFADRKSPTVIMKIGSLCLVVFSLPLLLLSDKVGIVGCLIASLCLIIFNEMVLGPSNAFLKNIFPIEFRYRGSSLSFTIGMAVLGGLTPIVENFLYRWQGHFAAIALWLMFIGLGTFGSIFLVRSGKRLRPNYVAA